MQYATSAIFTEPLLTQLYGVGGISASIHRSPSHSVFTKCEKASFKYLSTSTPVMTAQAQLSEPPSPKAIKDPKVHTTSKARQKKFLRHFPNVDNDEKVLNHYSCALIGDILLQGHLYITKNYFAFYSNVFGYVTKLLIPILSVQNITKEKTARIIPNAVGISTTEDKHIFGSLMSRDNTIQYMKTVWQKAKSASPIIIEPDILDHDLDSSDSGDGESGRDSPLTEIKPRFSLVKKLETHPVQKKVEGLLYERKSSGSAAITLKGAISELRELPPQRSDDMYHNLLTWQKQMHSKSADAAHSFIETNLHEIAKVRQSLEMLSSLLIKNKNPLAYECVSQTLEARKVSIHQYND